MPIESVYCPAISIKAYDSRGFGCFKYAGVCIIPTAYKFLEELITQVDYDCQIHEMKNVKICHDQKIPSTICKKLKLNNIFLCQKHNFFSTNLINLYIIYNFFTIQNFILNINYI